MKKKDFENHVYAYVRVSTVKQIQDSQISAINDYVEKKGIKIERWYSDVGTGKDKKRPQLQEMLKVLRAGDTVIVWRFDRISRSAQQLITIGEKLEEKGVIFVSINNDLDTSTKEGKLFYTILAGFAEYEAAIIQERVQEGLLASRKKGIVGGRPRKNEEEINKAIKMYNSNKYTFAEIKNETGVSKSTIYRRVKENKAEEYKNQHAMMVDIIDDEEKLLDKLNKLKSEMEVDLAIPLSGEARIEKFIKEAKSAWLVYQNIVEDIDRLEDAVGLE